MIPEKIANSHKAVCDMIESFYSQGQKILRQLIGFHFNGNEVSEGSACYLFKDQQVTPAEISDMLETWDVVLHVLDLTDERVNDENSMNVEVVGIVIFTNDDSYRGTWVIDLESGRSSPSHLITEKAIESNKFGKPRVLH